MNNTQTRTPAQEQLKKEVEQEMQLRKEEENELQVSIKQKYKTTPFILTDKEKDWLSTASIALLHSSPADLQVSSDEFIDLIIAAETDKKLFMYQVGALCNNMEARTPKELSLTLTGYLNMLRQTQEVAVRWNRKANEIVEVLRNELTEKQAARMKALEDKYAIGMNVVKAEA